jgi:protein SCO1/2
MAMRLVRYVLWGLVLVAGAMTAGVYVGRALVDEPGIVADSSVGAALVRSRYAEAGGPFTLVDTDGNTVTEADFAGRPRAMFFGFTHCPDVCPTSMVDASQWLDALGEDAAELAVIFVSVDPERDRPENLKRYLGAFDERIVGLTADDPQTIATVAERYGVRYEKVPLSNGGYTMNHTADTLLFDGNGEFAGFIPYTPPNVRANDRSATLSKDRAVEKLRELVGS